ncbi:Pls/PosA family non-ribosomal peptide synthetase, partial [Pseudonocardia eucalypti]|uniref:Pls/PosA family non-ribosomal peptide synthetase n=1 Tax=Pseudonocardia eucalypti TaxID=648755 RepID=UPI0031EEF000
NREDLTREAFIPDFLGIPGNPSGRIYRTGDLGRVNTNGEIEYHGQITRPQAAGAVTGGDGAALPTQMLPVQAPNPTVELPPASPALAEALAPLAEAPAAPASGIAQALAEVLAEVLGVDEVSVDGNFFDDLGADSMVMARFCARARKQPDLPSVSMKDIYRHTTIRGLATALADPASTSTERGFAEVLAQVLGIDEVSVDGNFFDDLGADSMVMARFCARARKRLDLPSVSMKDIYRHTTIRGLATALGESEPGAGGLTVASVAASLAPSGTLPAVLSVSSPVPPSAEVARFAREVRRRRPAPAGKPRYVLCAALQLLFFLGYCCLVALATVRGAEWISTATAELDIYLRSVEVGTAAFLGLVSLPIVAKWLIIGRWKPQELRVWSLPYVGFWLVKTLIRMSPLARMGGSPLQVLYLRALGAKIGRGVTILSTHVPVCTDMLTIGEGTVIRKDTFFNCYRARAGVIEVGPVTLGRDVYIGEATVLDIGTSIGDGAQLGHSSALHAGQAVPAGERWHGSPAQPTDTDYRVVPPARVGTARRALWATGQLVVGLFVYLPLALGGLYLLLGAVPWVRTLLGNGPLAFTSWAFYADAIVASVLLFLGGVVGGLLFVFIAPRLLGLFITPGKVYRLYGFHHWVQRAITRITNRKFYTHLFGDSSYIVDFLRSLGYGLHNVEQTGSNFGMDVKQDNPYLSSAGSGTVIADGLSIINADFSSTSFRVSAVSIGAYNFLGNLVAYPAQGRTGDNCLLATKVMVPIDGEIREGVGLLGSPCFEIPRTVARDHKFGLNSAEELRRGLAGKNRHNVASMLLRLLSLWLYFLMVSLFTLGAIDLYHSLGVLAFAASNALTVLFTAVYFVLVDRTVRGLQALRPDGVSIYDRDFWRHERYWKVRADGFVGLFNGTPFKNVIWRMMGARVGRRVFDDGCFLTERTFATIGDDCTLNEGSYIWCHSQEDGAFKSDLSALGAGCTLGVGAFVHYGVTMGDGSELAADSFLMKGEEIPSGEYWGGNPAQEIANADRVYSS